MECLDGGITAVIIMKVSIFHPEGNIGNNPSLRAIVAALLSAGHSVTYISNPSPQGGQDVTHSSFVSLCIRPEVPLDVVAHGCNLVIGVDEGIIPASRQSSRTGAPLFFISYEIFYDEELCSWRDKRLKRKMVGACTNIFCAVAQDTVRAESLSNEFCISKDKILCIPVAGEGCMAPVNSYYLHDHCHIPKNKKILLHFGTVASWSMAPWLMEHAETLPTDWVLVIHDRYGSTLASVPQTKDRCYFSTQPLLFKDMAKIVQSATACAVLYSPQYNSKHTGRNLKEIGFSSGKLSLALQHGIPVVVNMPAHAKLVTKYTCGIVINPASQKPLQGLEVCSRISADSCHHAFVENLDFSLAKPKLLELLKNASGYGSTAEIHSAIDSSCQKSLASYLFFQSIKIIILFFIKKIRIFLSSKAFPFFKVNIL
ncbi:MAG: hypothetical protein LBC94_03395 [Desulfovibrio sp.]|nr:hypothetical protein [Desulfovibrio sp.]